MQETIKEIIVYFRRILQGVDMYSKELEKRYQVTEPQLCCLLALNEAGSLYPSQLSKCMFVSPSTITGILDRLERKELVHRVRSSQDRRIIIIELTEKGRDLARYAPSPIHQEIIEGLAKLDSTEVKQILTALQRLADLMEKRGLPLDIKTISEE